MILCLGGSKSWQEMTGKERQEWVNCNLNPTRIKMLDDNFVKSFELKSNPSSWCVCGGRIGAECLNEAVICLSFGDLPDNWQKYTWQEMSIDKRHKWKKDYLNL